jgi:hypothetical protein
MPTDSDLKFYNEILSFSKRKPNDFINGYKKVNDYYNTYGIKGTYTEKSLDIDYKKVKASRTLKVRD